MNTTYKKGQRSRYFAQTSCAVTEVEEVELNAGYNRNWGNSQPGEIVAVVTFLNNLG